jgi:hypothetical protein
MNSDIYEHNIAKVLFTDANTGNNIQPPNKSGIQTSVKSENGNQNPCRRFIVIQLPGDLPRLAQSLPQQ